MHCDPLEDRLRDLLSLSDLDPEDALDGGVRDLERERDLDELRLIGGAMYSFLGRFDGLGDSSRDASSSSSSNSSWMCLRMDEFR